MTDRSSKKSRKEDTGSQDLTSIVHQCDQLSRSDITSLIQSSITQSMCMVRSDLAKLIEEGQERAQIQFSKSLNDHFLQMNDRYDQLQKDFHEFSSCHDTRVVKIEEKLLDVDQKYHSLENSRLHETELMRAASSRIDHLSAEILQLKRANNDLDQESRYAKLRISGLPVDNVNAKESFITFCHDKLNLVTIQPADIVQLQLIPVRRERARPPIVLVTFAGIQARYQVLRSRRQLKGSGIKISEDLTLCNAQLLGRLHKDSKFKESWSWNGKIYAISADTGKIIKVDPFTSVPNV